MRLNHYTSSDKWTPTTQVTADSPLSKHYANLTFTLIISLQHTTDTLQRHTTLTQPCKRTFHTEILESNLVWSSQDMILSLIFHSPPVRDRQKKPQIGDNLPFTQHWQICTLWSLYEIKHCVRKSQIHYSQPKNIQLTKYLNLSWSLNP